MSVFHPCGGDIGGGHRPNAETDGSSPGDSLTLKVRDIRLNISRTVQTNMVSQQSQLQTAQIQKQQQSSSSASDVRTATATITSFVTASSGANSISLHNIVRFSGKSKYFEILRLYYESVKRSLSLRLALAALLDRSSVNSVLKS